MSHLDEGRIHALLDGELDAGERRAAEEHLAACPDCRLALDEAKGFSAEADRIVGSLIPEPQPVAVSPSVSSRPKLAGYRWLAWAATVAIAVGLGYSGSALRRRATEGKVEAANQTVAEPESKEAQPPAAAPTSSAPRSVADRTDAGGNRRKQTNEAEPPSLGAAEKTESLGQPSSPQAPIAAAGVVNRDEALAAKTGLNDSLDRKLTDKDQAAEPPGRLREVPMPKPRTIESELDIAGFRPISLEEAVRVLGGSVQLIDGLDPVRVLAGPSSALLGADPSHEMVRVVYLDPPGRELWLDQQRSLVSSEAAQGQGFAGAPTPLMIGDTLIGKAELGQSSLQWVSQGPFRLALTGYLSSDSLRALARHVR
jgi:anti-sigma factor RsiW